MVEDFATFDHNGDGRVDDNDLLFAVTLRSGKPDQALVIPDADNNYFALLRPGRLAHPARPHAEPRAALRDRHRRQEHQPLRRDQPDRPAVPRRARGSATGTTSGRASASTGRPATARFSVHGGYGIYYDRITLQIQSLERGLDGRALPIEVKAGNVFFLDQNTGQFPPFAPSITNPFTGFILTGAGASGINIIDNTMQNPSVQQWNLGIEQALPHGIVLRVDGVHNLGTHFIIGRTIGEVFNPVVGGPDRVVNLESSVNTHYDALLVSAERRNATLGLPRLLHASARRSTTPTTTRSRSPTGRSIRTTCSLEYGPTPNDQRHRFTFAGLGAGAGRRPAWRRS